MQIKPPNRHCCEVDSPRELCPKCLDQLMLQLHGMRDSAEDRQGMADVIATTNVSQRPRDLLIAPVLNFASEPQDRSIEQSPQFDDDLLVMPKL